MTINLKNSKRNPESTKPSGNKGKMNFNRIIIKKFGKLKTPQRITTKKTSGIRTSIKHNNIRGKKSSSSKKRMVSTGTIIFSIKWTLRSLIGLKSSFLKVMLTLINSSFSKMIKTTQRMCKGSDLDSKILLKTLRQTMDNI